MSKKKHPKDLLQKNLCKTGYEDQYVFDDLMLGLGTGKCIYSSVIFNNKFVTLSLKTGEF